MQTNDLASAIAHYEMSLEKDSLLFPVYSNLATAYSMSNQPERAMETIDTWIELNPDEGRAYYLRGLLNFEFGNNEIAASDLQMAIDLNPTDTRAMYNLATYNYQNKNLTQAEVIIQKALSNSIKIIPLVDDKGAMVDFASIKRLHNYMVMEPFLNGNEIDYVLNVFQLIGFHLKVNLF